VSGKFNIPADFLSRIEEIGFPDSIDYDKLQQQQETDEELKHLLKPNANTSFQLKNYNMVLRQLMCTVTRLQS